MISKKHVYGFLLLHFGIVFYFWFRGVTALYAVPDPSNAPLAIGRLAGLLLASFTLLQLVFMSRSPFLYSLFSHEKMVKFHKTNGKLIMTLLLLHYIFIVNAYATYSGISPLEQIQTFIRSMPVVALAIASFWIFMIVGVTSIFFRKLKLKYEIWYGLHMLTYLAIVLAFLHQIELGGTLVNDMFSYYWIALHLVVVVLYLFFRFGLILIKFRKHKFFVNEVEDLGDYVRFTITGEKMKDLPKIAGSYFLVRFLDKKRFFESHPFSLSSSEKEVNLTFVAKKVGDFTQHLGELEVGTKVLLDGPHGEFNLGKSKGRDILFLAGGIGVTPIASMVSSLPKNVKATVFYAVRNKSDAVFDKKFTALKSKNIDYKIFFSNEGSRIKKNDLEKVKDISKIAIYICGGEGFSRGMRDSLKEIGVPAENIYFEEFSLH